MLKESVKALAFAVLLSTLAAGAAFAACNAGDRPPVPTQVKFFAVGDTSVYLQWAGRRNDYFDIALKQKSNGKVIDNIAGGLKGQWEKTYSGLQPNTEYEINVRSRTEGGTQGCVSASMVVLAARTTTTAIANACRAYQAKTIQQIAAMGSKKCPISGPRWSRDKSAHYQWCLDQRSKGQTLDASESAARDAEIAKCGTPAAGPAPRPSAGSQAPAEWNDMLSAHNERRKQHCTPALSWSSQIAAAAQARANLCNNQHDPDKTYGENLAFFTRTVNGQPQLPAQTDRHAYENAWYCEIKQYNFDQPTLSTGFTQNCAPPVNAHFTQVVWKASQLVGCGRQTCTINGQKGTYWVCKYSVPGNNTGTLAQNVLRPTCK